MGRERFTGRPVERDAHNEGKVGSQTGGLGIADVTTGLNDEARHVRDNTEAILADGVDNQVDIVVGGHGGGRQEDFLWKNQGENNNNRGYNQ